MRPARSVQWLTVGIIAIGAFAPAFEAQIATPQSRPSFEARAASLLPMRGSPLAATADAVYAISADQHQILMRPANLSQPWQPVTVDGTFSKLSGLAVAGRTLFASDRADETVYRIDLTTGQRAVLFTEGPLRNPGSIGIARDVFVADDLTFKVYRIRQNQVREIALDKEMIKGRELSLAGSGDDLLVSSPNGVIAELRGVGRADPEMPQKSTSQIYREKRSEEPLAFTIQKRAFPDIENPADIAIWKGVVYVVDSKLQSVFAFSRHDQRPVRLARGPASKPAIPSSLAINDSALFILSGNELQRWPRLIPSEVHLRVAGVSESMARVYEYLSTRDILPVRSVPFEQNVAVTLKTHRVILAGYPTSLDTLLCRLNPTLCDEKGKFRSLKSGADLRVPDLYSENYVDAVPITLKGEETLGDVADRRVTSPEFAEWKSEKRLKEMNESQLARTKVDSAREVRTGEYMTPVEYVRYLVPTIAGDASGDGALKRLERVFEGLRVISLEERAATAGSISDETTPQDPALAPLKLAFKAMLDKIAYFMPSDAQSLAKVGVAEEFIDGAHPDLQTALLAQDGVQPVAAAATAPPAGGVQYQIRSFEKSDHGTMVAGLIGARITGFEQVGLAPKAMLLPLRSADPAIGEDIRRARLRGVLLFNISAHYDRNVIPQSLLTAVNQYQNSLFIVAAGNDLVVGSNEEVCHSFMVYPACWHDMKNVLVVTATNANGDAILAAEGSNKGANWSGKAVHLAAPGIGYHAPAVNKSYAPVRGSSFATPLVTATAALLYAQSVNNPDPWAIKQRLIATADPEANLAGKVFGGRLNVRRALSDLSRGVLTRRVRQPDNTFLTETQLIVLDTGQITVRLADGEDLPLNIRKVRRIHKYGNGYRVVYLNGDQLSIFENVTFVTELNAQFRAITAFGDQIPISLLEWDDFVGPFSAD